MITFVLAVYNNLSLTKECYRHIRKIYPTNPLVISSGGSNDGTNDWLLSLNDENLKTSIIDSVISFSENYNNGIKLVDTDYLVLIHNDMIIGNNFIEKLEQHSAKNRLLCYTTIEPPIFADHIRPGKIIMDLGSSFDNFKYNDFNSYVNTCNSNDRLYGGGTFFMSGHKSLFENVGYFDGETFNPCFCEDDDFLFRTILKGYHINTIESAIVYHFVSKTSRFSNEFREKRDEIERNSNLMFIKKWGISVSQLHSFNLWKNGYIS